MLLIGQFFCKHQVADHWLISSSRISIEIIDLFAGCKLASCAFYAHFLLLFDSLKYSVISGTLCFVEILPLIFSLKFHEKIIWLIAE